MAGVCTTCVSYYQDFGNARESRTASVLLNSPVDHTHPSKYNYVNTRRSAIHECSILRLLKCLRISVDSTKRSWDTDDAL